MVLAINFKQMALYFALPFGSYALGLIINRVKKANLRMGSATFEIMRQVFHLIFVFVMTTTLIWFPWIFGKTNGRDLV